MRRHHEIRRNEEPGSFELAFSRTGALDPDRTDTTRRRGHEIAECLGVQKRADAAFQTLQMGLVDIAGVVDGNRAVEDALQPDVHGPGAKQRLDEDIDEVSCCELLGERLHLERQFIERIGPQIFNEVLPGIAGDVQRQHSVQRRVHARLPDVAREDLGQDLLGAGIGHDQLQALLTLFAIAGWSATAASSTDSLRAPGTPK
ncbi:MULTISPECIES: hypothetical protein [unclassified Bradyrhizobium]|uniref:hypothetical protein n=1 Tax=unclassified Bradyrhizobium TaxID=2631580 RepID=UPI00200055A6|nr:MULTISPECIES: hypothetical protein [unclassified Bradyrhizobium]UPJ27818.1 hypothetical protein IVB54_01620 [Bradyrhizobium sp. CW1]UPJ96283.1 hypothetical protein IVB07_01520 [Bradyrhizobium sp. 172]